MKEHKSYIGKLNGVSGIWCDQKPEDLKLEEEITYYVPDEGKIFERNGKLFDVVVIKKGIDIRSYAEIDKPKEENDD